MKIDSFFVDFCTDDINRQTFINCFKDIQLSRVSKNISSGEDYCYIFSFKQSWMIRRSMDPLFKLDMQEKIPIMELYYLQLDDPDFSWKKHIKILVPSNGFGIVLKTKNKDCFKKSLFLDMLVDCFKSINNQDYKLLVQKGNDIFLKDKKFFGAEIQETENGYYIDALCLIDYLLENENMEKTDRHLYTKHSYEYTGLGNEYPSLTNEYVQNFILKRLKEIYDCN